MTAIFTKRIFGAIAVATFSLIFTACGNKSDKSQEKTALYPEITLDHEQKQQVKLSDIFSDFKLIALETNEDCLIGDRGTRILKHDSLFFISSNNEILVFNNDGKYLKKLSAFGPGPEEYEQIGYFEIADDINEIWICPFDGRTISRYDLDSFDFKGKLSFDFAPFSIKSLGDGLFIANTSAEDGYFKIINSSGEIIESIYESDPANSGHTLVDFYYSPRNNKVIHQLRNSNDVIYYDLDSKKLGTSKLLDTDDNLLTAAANRKAMDELGYMEQMAYVRENYIQIVHAAEVDDMVIMILCYPDFKWKMLLSKNGKSVVIPYYPQDINIVENDIIDNVHPLTLNTIVCGDSDDSFIFMPNVQDTEDNPYILEVTDIKLP
ncbi:MAG: 6-bladed beta-propeller [Muribaculaceae bacterium]|nr:6-bladed beta-propeller [Muribaculaceae bacterium]